MNKEKFKSFIVQFIKFGLVGVLNTAISLAVYYIFIYINPALYLWGQTVGWVVSVLNAFYFSNRVVFKQESNTPKELWLRLLRSYIAYGSTFLLSLLLLYLQIEIWHISEWIAPIINLLITIPLNFIVNKFLNQSNAILFAI